MSNLGLKARLAGTAALEEGGEPAVDDLMDFTITTNKAADDALPADVTADTLIWSNPYTFPVRVMQGRYAPTTGNIVGNNTNTATINIKTDNGAPAGPAPAVVLAMPFPLTTGDVLQNDSRPFVTWTSDNSIVPPGGGVFVNITKAGTGLVIRAGVMVLRLRKL